METTIKSKALEVFNEVAHTLVNPSLLSWREQGGKIIGDFCAWVPQEMITAAGMLPYRMRATGSTGTELSDTYFSLINCSYPRHCLNIALRGEYDFVDGVIFLNTCDHVRRIYDNWKRQVTNTPFLHFISLPKKAGEPQVEWYREELVMLKGHLEEHFGVKITDESLQEAIKLHNETRRLQRKLYDLRKRKNPPINGADALAVTVASTAMPREQYNKLLQELLDEISDAEGISDYRLRLMLVGGILDDPDYIKIIEDQGGLVVTDSLCFGSRIVWNEVKEGTDDPIGTLARYQLMERPSCPRMFGTYPKRVALIKELINDFKVDGVIGERLLFCDHWQGEHFMLNKDYRKMGVPFLQLDREYILGGIGQTRTRVQAFLESIEGNR